MAYRYYRLRALENDTNRWVVGELQVRLSVGGANAIPGNSSVTVSSEISGFEKDKMLDGITTTAWASTTTGVFDIFVDMGSAVDVAELLLRSRNDAFTLGNATKLLMSGSNTAISGPWTDIRTWFRQASLYANNTDYLFPVATDPTKWSGYAQTTNDGYWVVTEAQMRTSTGGANAMTGGSIVASSDQAGAFPVTNLLDNNTSTFWASGSSGGAAGLVPASFTYTFPSPVTIVEMLLRTRIATTNGSALKLFLASPVGTSGTFAVLYEWTRVIGDYAVNTAYLFNIDGSVTVAPTPSTARRRRFAGIIG